ncbi:hypothetical protein N7532_006243 [Penicillium argentinense]|uniref:Autophagy-related protein 2/VPS13 C-terminal domain-containing protein n=1 Tax=Penicillium argentinense TaxID=1131581 RepID=A0A9W9KBS1_9EURO|nr:uncharacterized protein N7532_006243 [Penicillium argentinense]KAJ5099242.1 hypothetical protein N7532_006243 [Penicillium argentinense]
MPFLTRLMLLVLGLSFPRADQNWAEDIPKTYIPLEIALMSGCSNTWRRWPTSSPTRNRSLQTTQEEADDTISMHYPTNASSASGNNGSRIAGRMAEASNKSLAKFVPSALKGMTVDIPLAITEGMCNVPRSYGEMPQHQGSVTGIKSGFALRGTGFALGMSGAVSELVVKPYEGVRKDGAKGVVTGIGRGIANMTSKAARALFGVVVYPGVDIAKCLRSSIYSRTRKRIVKERRAKVTWLLENGRLNSSIASFQRLLKGKNT